MRKKTYFQQNKKNLRKKYIKNIKEKNIEVHSKHDTLIKR